MDFLTLYIYTANMKRSSFARQVHARK